jgi:hypothetical protein
MHVYYLDTTLVSKYCQAVQPLSPRSTRTCRRKFMYSNFKLLYFGISCESRSNATLITQVRGGLQVNKLENEWKVSNIWRWEVQVFDMSSTSTYYKKYKKTNKIQMYKKQNNPVIHEKFQILDDEKYNYSEWAVQALIIVSRMKPTKSKCSKNEIISSPPRKFK